MNEPKLNESQKIESKLNKSSKKHLRLVTAESVRAGHPDKFCDQIADAILDAHLAQDPNARVAVEVFATEGKIVIGGEVTSKADVNCARIVGGVIRRIGYRSRREQGSHGRWRSGDHGGLRHG